jgi:ubiquitin carboxyl-terminal hydrolase 5/13
VELPKAAAQLAEPPLNQDLLNQVLGMGIPENPAKHALYKTGNNSAEIAVAWYFENMADESLNQPLLV